MHVLVSAVEIPLAVATLLFWFLMMQACLRATHGLRSFLWIFVFVVGTCVTAQAYYFFLYRRSAALADNAVRRS
jgi:hypothetical protein